ALVAWPAGTTVLDGEFVVERMLGRGGYGIVALVTSQRTGARFAAKRSHHADAEERIRFLRELRHWFNLPDHAHLAACRFTRTSGDEVIVFANFADAGSLADWIADRRLYADGTGAALQRILDVAIQSAWGIEAAHAVGIVH